MDALDAPCPTPLLETGSKGKSEFDLPLISLDFLRFPFDFLRLITIEIDRTVSLFTLLEMPGHKVYESAISRVMVENYKLLDGVFTSR